MKRWIVAVAVLVVGVAVGAQAAPFATAAEQEARLAGNDAGRTAAGAGERDPASRKAASFTHAFVAGMSMMVVSELGDKTFFIAAIMSMRHSRALIFFATMMALGAMTVISAYMGAIATLIPRVYTTYLASALFAIFGLRLLRDGYRMSPDEGSEELEEVTQELKAKEEKQAATQQNGSSRWVNQVCVDTMLIMLTAELGDRSQIATVVLGAREDTMGVVLGAILGHAFCTFLAVMGGRFLAQRISVRTVTIVGGFVFLLFAISGLVMDDEDNFLTSKLQSALAPAAVGAGDSPMA